MIFEILGAGKARAGLYIAFILITAASGFVYSARVTGLFACQPSTAGSNEYVGICNVTGFGDYDHGAFWFELEEEAVNAARKATVLLVGNSRMQAGLSTDRVEEWFGSRSLAYYLLGFSHQENYLFLAPLLEKIGPSAKMYIVNIDNFFDDKLTGPANSVMNEPESLNRYKQKSFWQDVHRFICGKASRICGNGRSYVRRTDNGAWTFRGGVFGEMPISYDWSAESELLDNYERNAREFVASFAASPACIVLTITPHSDTSAGTARYLGERLGLPVIAPEVEELTTFDGSHLNPESANRWSDAFVTELEPLVPRCFRESST